MARHDDVFEVAANLSAAEARALNRYFEKAADAIDAIDTTLKRGGLVTRDMTAQDLLEWSADVSFAYAQQTGGPIPKARRLQRNR